MTSDTTRRRLIKSAAAIGTAAAVPNTVSANHSSTSSGFFAGELPVENDGIAAQALAMVGGLQERAELRLQGPQDAHDLGRQIQQHFNPRSEDYRTWVNERNLGGEGHQVLELRLEQGRDADTRYLVSTYDTGTEAYTAADMVDEQTFADTGRTVDQESVLEGGAAAAAPGELREFYSRFISTNDDLASSYKSRMASKYGSNPNVTSELLGDKL
jgi:hypothetical protein